MHETWDKARDVRDSALGAKVGNGTETEQTARATGFVAPGVFAVQRQPLEDTSVAILVHVVAEGQARLASDQRSCCATLIQGQDGSWKVVECVKEPGMEWLLPGPGAWVDLGLPVHMHLHAALVDFFPGIEEEEE